MTILSKGFLYAGVTLTEPTERFEHSPGVQYPVGVFRAGKTVDGKFHLLLFRPPLGHLAFPKILGNLAIQLVDVGRVHAISYGGETGFQTYSLLPQSVLALTLVCVQHGHDLRNDLQWQSYEKNGWRLPV